MDAKYICENKPEVNQYATKESLRRMSKIYNEHGMTKCLSCLGTDPTCSDYRPRGLGSADRFDKSVKGTLVASVI